VITTGPRARQRPPSLVFAAGSVAIALLAGIWLLERSLDIVIFLTS
jgi:hypothetical protein